MSSVANPLRDAQDRRLPRIAGPSGLVIFGVTGDLSRKKLMPAVYDLANRGLLPPGFSLVGFARRDWEHEDFAQIVHDAVKEHARTPFREEVWQQLAEGMRFVPGVFDDDEAFKRLKSTIEELDASRGTGGNFAFYLSVPPKFFPTVLSQLKKHGLNDGGEDSWRRAVVEKPFGHDLKSARELNAVVHQVFRPSEVFRIDHYLGKETVQNILALRFANTMFEPLWNRSYVDHVQITMAEDIGIGGRAGYYDGIGSARDVIQNHLLQLLALTAMEEPASFDAKALVTEKLKVLNAVRLPRDLGRHTVRGQYAAGWQGGRKVPGYLDEEGIDAEVDDRHLRGAAAADRQPPLGRRALLPAHRQAAGPAGHRDRRRLPARPALAVRHDRHPGAGAERAGHPGAAGRGHHDPVRLEGTRHPDGDPGRDDGLRLRRVLHRVQPRGLRAAHPGRTARRRQPLPASPGGGAVLGDPRPGRGVLEQRRRARAVPGRHLGADGGGRDARARRTELAAAMNIDLTDTTSSQINASLVKARRASGTPAVGMVLTLVIVTDEGNHYDALKAATEASKEHPSRILVVVRRPGRSPRDRAKARLDAEVRMGSEAGAGETVLLRLHGELASHSYSVVLPLLLPDAPVVVWWPEDAPRKPSEDLLGTLAQRRITDASQTEDPVATLDLRADDLRARRHRPVLDAHHPVAQRHGGRRWTRGSRR